MASGRLRTGRLTLDWERVGDGEPVALLHAAPFVDWYGPLRSRLDGCAVLTYRRSLDPVPKPGRPYSGPPDPGPPFEPPFDLAEDAAAFEALAEQLGLGAVHLVGHSYGGLLALEVARRRRGAVRSLTLIEPAGAGFLPPEQARQAFASLLERYRIRGGAAALGAFLSSVCGTDVREQLEAAVPGAWRSGCRAADQFFQAELPAVCRWTFGPDDARSLPRPIEVIVGTATDPRFARAADLLQGWMPDATRVEIPRAGHLLIVQAPGQIVDALRSLWLRS